MAYKLGFGFIILYIFIVIAVQFALATNTVREVFTSIDSMEGTTNAAIIDNIGTVEVELKAQPLVAERFAEETQHMPVTEDGETSQPDARQNNLRILVNGQLAGYFDEPQVWIVARNNSLIEIDATNEPNPYRISVSDASDNAMDISRKLEVTADGNIAILGKIYVR